MEKRAILAFGLSAFLLFTWLWIQQEYFPSPKPPAREAPADPARSTPPDAPKPAPGDAPKADAPAKSAAPSAPVSATASPPAPPQRAAEVETPRYHAVISSEGGKLLEWTLDYRGRKPLVAVGEFGPRGLSTGPAGAQKLETLRMTLAPEKVVVTPENPSGEVVLTGQAEGVEIKQTMAFDAVTYAVRVRVDVKNPSAEPRKLALALPWTARRRWSDDPERFPGQRPIEVAWSVGGHVDRAPHAMAPTLDSLTEAPTLGREGEWIAIGSVWYLAALMPKSPGFVLDVSVEKPDTEPAKGPSGWVTVELRATPTVAPGQTWTGEALMYVGPKQYEELRALGIEETLNFGGFPLPWYYGGLPMRWIGVPILLLMKWLYGFIGNYGIAIIILTVVSKVLFYPLTVKGIRSMKAMQALQPQINALRTKYKSDPQRVQRETLELYRKHGVNPAGGCLPMLAQVPIFYALYLALSVSVELQNAKFICFGKVFGVDLWICDLAAQDPTYILPVLMGVTMFVQQKMSPQMGDPRQAKMMLVMPFVFTIMFVNLPSGLVLYWTVSNVLQILQQWYMDQPRARSAAREAKDASGA